LGTKVEVREGGKGRGKIVVHFNSHEEFERIRGQLCSQMHNPPQPIQPEWQQPTPDGQQSWPQNQAG
jgi:hypothetical protein